MNSQDSDAEIILSNRAVQLLHVVAEKNIDLTDELISSLYSEIAQRQIQSIGDSLLGLAFALGAAEETTKELVNIKRFREILNKFLSSKDTKIKQLEEQIRKNLGNGDQKNTMVLLERLNVNAIELSKLEDTVKQLKNSEKQKTEAIEKLQAEKSDMEALTTQLFAENEVQRLNLQKQQAQSQGQDKAQIEQLKKQNTEILAKVTKLTQELDSSNLSITHLNSKLQLKDDEILQLKKEILQLKNEKAHLEEAKAAIEKEFYQTVEEMLSNTNKKPAAIKKIPKT